MTRIWIQIRILIGYCIAHLDTAAVSSVYRTYVALWIRIFFLSDPDPTEFLTKEEKANFKTEMKHKF